MPRRAAVIAAAATLWATSGAAVAQRTAKQRVRAAAFVVGDDSRLSSSRQATLQITLERVLERDRRLEVVDKDRTLAENAGAVPREVLSEVAGLLETSEALLHKNRPKLALLRLQAAVRQLERWLAWSKKSDLARAQFLLGAAHAMLGDPGKAREQFLALQVWRPTFVVNTEIAPGKVLPLWEQARKRAAARPGGSLEIRSGPDQALAYVDGRFVGFTPTTAEGLAEGVHYITVRKLGYQRAVVPSAVSGDVQQSVRADLIEVPGADELSDLAFRAGEDLGQSPGPISLTALAEELSAEHLVFVRAPAVGAGDPTYQGFIYSRDERKLLASASGKTSDDKSAEELLKELVRALYAQVVFEPPPPPPVAKKKPKKPRTRAFYKRWWFWTGVVAAGAVGVAIPMLMDDGATGPSCPPGNVCGDIVIRF